MFLQAEFYYYFLFPRLQEGSGGGHQVGHQWRLQDCPPCSLQGVSFILASKVWKVPRFYKMYT